MNTLVKPKETPLLLRSDLVRKVLDGTKTMTRRPVKPQFPAWAETVKCGTGLWYPLDKDGADDGHDWRICPYGQPGDLLWVRETFWEYGYWTHWAGSEPIEPVWCPAGHDSEGNRRADCVRFDPPAAKEKYRWLKRSSIHMPKWACRLWLEITEVRVERIQEITEEDAKAEGYVTRCNCPGDYGQPDPHHHFCPASKANPMDLRHARQAFWLSWDKTYPGSWDRSDWVWCISFKKVDRPSD